MKIVVPPLLTLPSGRPLSPTTLTSIVIDGLVKGVTGSSPSIDQMITSILALQIDSYPELMDTSTGFVKSGAVSDHSRIIERALIEYRVFATVRARYSEGVREGRLDLAQLSSAIHQRLGASANGFRIRSVGVGLKTDGTITDFIDHNTIVTQLARASAFVNEHGQRSPALVAIVAYIAIIHAHPFMDGNGRTARVIYNLILSAWQEKPCFLPIETFSVITAGALVLKVRRAIFFGQWNDLQRLFMGATRFTLRQQA